MEFVKLIKLEIYLILKKNYPLKDPVAVAADAANLKLIRLKEKLMYVLDVNK